MISDETQERIVDLLYSEGFLLVGSDEHNGEIVDTIEEKATGETFLIVWGVR